MAAVSIGKGYAGILMNLIQIVIIAVTGKEKQDPDLVFNLTVFYQILTAFLMLLISILYFYER